MKVRFPSDVWQGGGAAVKRHRFFLRAGIAAAVAVMLLLLAAWSSRVGNGVQAAGAAGAVLAFQDGTEYPYDNIPTETLEDPGDLYPFEETEIPFEGETPFATDQPLVTPTTTATLPPNAFLTENAEISGGQVTPPPSATPGPTITVYISPTAPTRTPRPTGIPAGGAGGDGPVDWGYFSLGFAVPVVAACGFVLYLLDRRPDLFRRRA
jgi:hypothetical protein